jgi:hypothetical protein
MKKTELVHLHMLLAQFKKYCEANGFECDFTKYTELSTSPLQVHLSLEEHERAIFVLTLALLAATKPHPEADMKEACSCMLANFYVPLLPVLTV